MSYRPRCHCGHPHDQHEHHRKGADCGSCGPSLCPAYASISAPRPPTHHLVGAYSDAHAWRNLAALSTFASTRRHVIPVPAQRRPIRSIAGEYINHVKATRRSR